MRKLLIIILLFLNSCIQDVTDIKTEPENNVIQKNSFPVSIVVLGNVQDAGSPHAGCNKNCCKYLFEIPDPNRMVVSLGIIDSVNQMNWLIEATPDLPRQMKLLKNYSSLETDEVSDGIFLTHAHIGHYTGLQYLGRESMNASQVPVYVLPRMKMFLETNGPWSQLVKLENIILRNLQPDSTMVLSSKIRIQTFTVPHRDEFSETAGFIIEGPNKKALFIPDIDKWEKWEKDIIELIHKVDYAFLDATFYDGKEINNRDISEIPHPFVIESMDKFRNLPTEEKNKIWLIHFNHTNPLLDANSESTNMVTKNGFHIARLGDVFEL